MHDAHWISHFMSTKLSPAVLPDLSDSDREQMERVLTAVLAALRPHPEARAAVVAGFEALDLSDSENASYMTTKTTKRTQEVIDNKAGCFSGTGRDGA
jgi:hypothetical protein